MEEIIEILSIKYNLPKAAIRAVCESPFRFLAENMRERKMDIICFMGLGKFVVHPKKKKWIQENLLEKAIENERRRKELRTISKADYKRMGQECPEGTGVTG